MLKKLTSSIMLKSMFLLAFSASAQAAIYEFNTDESKKLEFKNSSTILNNSSEILAKDSLLNVSGVLVRKTDAMKLFSMLYKKNTGVEHKMIDVFATNKKDFIGCVVLINGKIDVFYTDGKRIYSKNKSKKAVGIDSNVVIDHYRVILFSNDDKKVPQLKISENIFNTKAKVDPGLKALEEKYLKKKLTPTQKLEKMAAIAKKGIPNLKTKQFSEFDKNKKNVYVFVSNTCPNCIKYMKIYHDNREEFDKKFNFIWVPIGSDDSKGWQTFFKSPDFSITRKDIMLNESVIWGMNKALEKTVATPTMVWYSKSVSGGIGMIQGGILNSQLDKLDSDSVRH